MPQIPPITDEMRAYAHQHPNSWLYLVDPAYQNESEPPEHAVIGAYHIAPDGTIDERFHSNDTYRPSALAAARLEPSTELEHVLLRISDGQEREDSLPAAVLRAEILLYAPRTQDTAVYAAELSDGAYVVPACTSPGRVPETWPAYRAVPGWWLPDLLDGRDLGLNLDDPIQALIPYRLLHQAAGHS